MKPPRFLVPLLLAATIASSVAAPDEATALAVLASDADIQKKSLACNDLAVVGTARAVPALAALLGDERLAAYARSGLEMIDDVSATQALLDALPQLQGRLLAGAVTSLGNRGDAAAVPALRTLATKPGGAAEQALSALAKIGGEEAVKTIITVLENGPAELMTPAADAALHSADRATEAGKPADVLLDAIARAAVPAHIKAAAAAMKTRGITRLFNGTSFDGWEGNLDWFRIKDGAVIAGSLEKNIPHNEFLCTTREYGDFELRLKLRTSSADTNGGIQIRSRRVPGTTEMFGYQADAGMHYWGGLYDEGNRKRFLVKAPDSETLSTLVRHGDWNDYRIRCEGARVRIWLNGRLTTDFTETDATVPRTGLIALQIHSGKPREVSYKDIEIEELK